MILGCDQNMGLWHKKLEIFLALIASIFIVDSIIYYIVRISIIIIHRIEV
jgi:hypothetical protein